jgi:hypothetical protein
MAIVAFFIEGIGSQLQTIVLQHLLHGRNQGYNKQECGQYDHIKSAFYKDRNLNSKSEREKRMLLKVIGVHKKTAPKGGEFM